MSGTRRFFVYVFSVVLFWALGIGIASQAFAHTLGHSSSLKDRLRDNQTYIKAVPSIVTAVSNSSTSSDDLLKTPEGQQATLAAFDPEFVRITTEGAIDSVYNWLDGTTPQLMYTAQLTPDQAALWTQLNGSGAEPAAAPPTLSLPVSHPLNTSLPLMYKLAEKTWIWWTLSGVSAGIIIIAADPRRRGVKTAAWTLVFAGALTLLSSSIGLLLINRFSIDSYMINQTDMQKAIFTEIIDPVATGLMHDFLFSVLVTSAIVTGIGVLLYVTLKMRRPARLPKNSGMSIPPAA